MMIDLDFIQRCQGKEFQEVVEKSHKESCMKQTEWRNKNPEKFKKSQIKYSKSEKGKVASQRRNAILQERFKEHLIDLSEEDKEMIRSFYANCPGDCEVDHKIPLSRGGKHHIDNLQYLTIAQNRFKGRGLINLVYDENFR